jgi:Icc-related predicted phosphoesterase
MTRRVRIEWPDPRPFESRGGRPIRLLAASDEPDRALEFERNREALGPIDAILGAGDLEPHWLEFLADAFHVPLAFVTGNHDRGIAWDARRTRLPTPLGGGSLTVVAGLRVAALAWPGGGDHGAVRDEGRAWSEAIRLAVRRLIDRLKGRREPLLVVSHVPPEGANDGPDPYHLGFRAYRWLLDRLQPPLWLHGHVNTASVRTLECVVEGTTLVNVTGSVLVELVPPGDGRRPPSG